MTPEQRFPYYERLTKKEQRTYDRSDAVTEVALPSTLLPALQKRARHVAVALASDRQPAVQAASRELVRRIVEALGAGPVEVRVRAVRPSSAEGELHGLYTREEDGRATIEVWMRTAARGAVVAPRTYLRTLLHELVHHLDFEVLKLEDTFHTRGFFRRESSLVRQLETPRAAPSATTEVEPETREGKLRRLRKALGAADPPQQLALDLGHSQDR